MTSHSDGAAQGGVWPGYVAAVACLLQALVLVCGVIALIIATVSVTKTSVAPTGMDSIALDSLSQKDVVNVRYLDETIRIPRAISEDLLKSLNQLTLSRSKKIIVWINAGANNESAIRQAYLRIMYIKTLFSGRPEGDQNVEYRIFTEPATAYRENVLHISNF